MLFGHKYVTQWLDLCFSPFQPAEGTQRSQPPSGFKPLPVKLPGVVPSAVFLPENHGLTIANETIEGIKFTAGALQPTTYKTEVIETGSTWKTSVSPTVDRQAG